MTDPTSIRLSDHFLLSDLMGCHSCYTKGYANVFDDKDGSKAEEGVCLAETVLEAVVALSPVSVSYGYISQPLAHHIVSYQDPKKKSYHQWNDGAACDIIVHNMDRGDTAPIYIARAIDSEFPVSRVITYSESPFICVATRRHEVLADRPRRAFYENRYMGHSKTKPLYTTIPQDRDSWFANHFLKHDWRGQGYPSYHGGGVRQTHHIRTSKYTMLSDFLYSTEALTKGKKNCPTLTSDWVAKFRHVGKVYDYILDTLKVNRLSIVRAYESPVWNKTPRHLWGEDFEIDFIPPVNVDANDVADTLLNKEGIIAVSVTPKERRVCICGVF